MLLLAIVWSFAEAILFFIVADVPISWIAVRYGWRRGAAAAVAAALAATAGGSLLYLWASADPAGAAEAVGSLPGIDQALIADTASRFRDEGYPAMFVGSLSGVPYKLYVLAAAREGREILSLLLLTPLLRLPRFLAAAAAAALVGKTLSLWLSMRARLLLLAGFWLLFYGFYFAVSR
jgi:hypothetical protein